MVTSESGTIRRYEAGPMETWGDQLFAIPGMPAVPKCFLKGRLGMKGMEVSLNALKPGVAMPQVHRHRVNEELYLFLSGRGEFHADGELLPIEAGTCIRCEPEVGRSWRNTGQTELVFVVIQAPNRESGSAMISDGELVDEPPRWAKS
ncbi:Cupin domain protein [Planctomycetes bacterium Pan216]|uniref:Cupin domain protein n=1 Tax=Kolteria novifilia TaxID=2527975 RepID=A0A518AXL2_9BACT|nr:Cupin domain protein [Planctomycetes bacterium Pan216]